MSDDRGIDIQQAAGMLAGLTSGHVCTEACTSRVALGDGKAIQLVCPYSRLNPEVASDRRIIGTLYAEEARNATASATRR